MTNPHITFKYAGFKPYEGFRQYSVMLGWQQNKHIKQYGVQFKKSGYIYFWRFELVWNLGYK